MSGRCVSKSALHYTKIGDAGGVQLQPVEPSEFGSAHYTKIGDAGVRRRGLWTSLGSGPRWEIGETMNILGQLALASKRISKYDTI